MTEIIGVGHLLANLEECKAIIDEAGRRGIRTIGIERSLSEEFWEKLKNRFGEKFSDIFWKGALGTEFFFQLKKYAEARNVTVVSLGSQFFHEYLNRLILEHSPAHSEELISPEHFSRILYGGAIKDTETMVKQIQKINPPMVIVGGVHALGVSRALGIPIKEIRLVGITLEGLVSYERLAEHLYRRIKLLQRARHDVNRQEREMQNKTQKPAKRRRRK
jgi:hypothetical protein